MKTNKNKENKQDLFEVFTSSIGAISNLISDDVINKLKNLELSKDNELNKSKENSLESVFLDTKQACNFLSMTKQTLAQYVRAGRIKKYVKGQRGNLYKKSDLIKFIENGVK